MTRRAAELCKSGGDARAALRELLVAVEAEYGAAHDASELIRLYAGPSGAATSGETSSNHAIDPTLDRALKELRACAAAPVRTVIPKITLKQHLSVGLKLYERALYRQAHEAAELANELVNADTATGDRMKLHDLMAKILLQLGKRDAAIEEAVAADELAEQIGATANRIDYARLYAQAGDLERAQVQLDRLASADLKAADRAEYAEVQGDIALLLGSPHNALTHLEIALDGHRNSYGNRHSKTAAVLQLQGDAYRLAGDFPAAIDAYRKTLQMRRDVLGPDHVETARTQNSIGVLQADLRDWTSADGAFEAALVSLRKTQSEESVDAITFRTNRALARWGAQQNRAAADQYAAAVGELRVALGGDHPKVAAVVRNQARMEFDLGQHDRAQQLLKDVLAAQIRVLGDQHPDLAPTRLARGRLLAQRGKLAEAAAEIDLAIEVLLVSLGPEHPVVRRARTTRAQTALAQGDYAVALNQSAAAASSIVVFYQRTFGAISDRQRALLSQDSHKAIGALLSVPDVDARDLFVALLPHRDSVLRSIAARRASERGDSGHTTELSALRKRYVAAVLGQGPDTAKRVKSLAQQIEVLEALQSTPDALSTADPAEVLKNACERLPSDAALIKLVAYDRIELGKPFETVPAYAALVVRGDGCRVSRVELGDGAELQKFAEEFSSAMRDQRMDHPIARVELSRVVLEPLKITLKGVKRWMVVPDGSLWGIPIGVLPDPENPDRYLLERVTVGYLTSTYELSEAELDRGKSQVLERSLLVGAPDFGDDVSGPVVLTQTGPCQLQPFEKLPGTKRELDDISQLLANPQLLVGADVTKQRLEQALENRPQLIHFATHAYFAGNGGCDPGADRDGLRDKPISPNPLLLSGIVLAGANRPTRVEAEGESGILTAYEVAGLDMRSADLVVLSACDTGTGLALRGQEVQGLRWGFRAAGARALVTSLWRSNDAATRRMMKSFYQSLLSANIETDALRGAEALRRAKLEQLASQTRLGIRQPLIWANFIFSGVL